MWLLQYVYLCGCMDPWRHPSIKGYLVVWVCGGIPLAFRFDLHLKWRQMWEVVSAPLDVSLSAYYEELADTESKIPRFLQRMRPSLGLLWGLEEVDDLLGAKAAFTKKPHTVAKVMENSVCGRAVFQSIWMGCSREIFRETARAHIKDLEKEEYAMDRVAQFKERMGQMVGRLRAEGHKRGQKNGMALCPCMALTQS